MRLDEIPETAVMRPAIAAQADIFARYMAGESVARIARSLGRSIRDIRAACDDWSAANPTVKRQKRP